MATQWGICGVGKISHDFSVAMKTLPAGEHQVPTFSTPNLHTYTSPAETHGIPKAYGSYQELLRYCASESVSLHVLHTERLKVGLLFLTAGKNVRCEKPFTMNLREVKQLITASRKNNVFLMDLWGYTEDAVGDVKLVKAYFGSPQLHIPCSVEKGLGGGALLDIGVYCLQYILMVFKGERTKSVHATGVLLDSGRGMRNVYNHCSLTLWHAPVPHVGCPSPTLTAVRAGTPSGEDGMERAVSVEGAERKTRTPPTDTSHESNGGRRRTRTLVKSTTGTRARSKSRAWPPVPHPWLHSEATSLHLTFDLGGRAAS
uniref:Trans-1,2-dihydrobenzene-1,2-diol dehydrogenase n=1 Tax=Pygocentrus nattereri TaxID=42514 RepID=A0A3B4DHG5_PYGNA